MTLGGDGCGVVTDDSGDGCGEVTDDGGDGCGVVLTFFFCRSDGRT